MMELHLALCNLIDSENKCYREKEGASSAGMQHPGNAFGVLLLASADDDEDADRVTPPDMSY